MGWVLLVCFSVYRPSNIYPVIFFFHSLSNCLSPSLLSLFIHTSYLFTSVSLLLLVFLASRHLMALFEWNPMGSSIKGGGSYVSVKWSIHGQHKLQLCIVHPGHLTFMVPVCVRKGDVETCGQPTLWCVSTFLLCHLAGDVIATLSGGGLANAGHFLFAWRGSSY